jgi:hypothetical protein
MFWTYNLCFLCLEIIMKWCLKTLSQQETLVALITPYLLKTLMVNGYDLVANEIMEYFYYILDYI